MTRYRFLITALLAAGSFVLPSQARQSGLAFLRVGPDAASLGMGDAGAAVTRDVFSVERNPAGLAGTESTEFALSHHVWIGDVRTYGAAVRFGSIAGGGLGVYFRATGSGGLEARSRPGPAEGIFEAQFMAAGVGYGRSIGPVRIGVAAKYLSERIEAVSADGLAIDAGVQVDVIKNAVTVAGFYRNAGSMDNLVQRSTRLPRLVGAGIAVYPFRVLAFDDGALLMQAFITADVVRNIVDESTHVHIGASVDVMETVRVRAGYLTNDALRDVSIGAGIRVSEFRLDYAMMPFTDGFGGPGHAITLLYRP